VVEGVEGGEGAGGGLVLNWGGGWCAHGGSIPGRGWG
jgi:hypothetical protein